MSQIRILTANDVRQALPMHDCIAGMKQAYAAVSDKSAVMPLRGRLHSEHGITLTMPAYIPQTQSLALKLVSVFEGNTTRGIAPVQALVTVLNPETGEIVALMEGNTLTAIRTGAGGGAAADVLARPDAATMAMIGSGVQAKSGLEAICAVRNITKVRVYSRNLPPLQAYVDMMMQQDFSPGDIEIANSADDAVRDADIVYTATTAAAPVFDGNALKPGTHISAVGAYTPDMHEVDTTTIQQAYLTVDSKEAVLEEAGELISPIAAGLINADDLVELGAIINGNAPGRSDPEQITYFKSVGIAAQDAIAASIALKNAEAQNIGTLITL